ncbi:MAG: hypothetical protein ABIO02_01330, partial [Patescibacteria group bacterium]
DIAEKIALYKKAAEEYGLGSHDALSTIPPTTFAESFVDTSQIERDIEEAIKNNLPTGISELVANHLRYLQHGKINLLSYSSKIMEEYLVLAKKYDLPVDPIKVRQEILSHMTAENLRAGVLYHLEQLKEEIREARYTAVNLRAKEVEEFRKFVREQGFEGKVDFSSLDKYMDETATQLPQLDAGRVNHTPLPRG